jgi:hypothetical protein
VLDALKVSGGADHTSPDDYLADSGDAGVEEIDLGEHAADAPRR